MAAAPERQSAGERTTVLHCLPDLHIGGVARLLLTNVRGLDPGRFRSVVASLRSRDDLLPEFERAGLSPRFMGHTPYHAAPRTLLRLVTLIRRERVDIVHTHLTEDRFYGGIAARLCGRPLMVTLHSTAPVPAASIVARSGWSRRVKWNLVDAIARRWAERVLVVSEAVGRVATSGHGIPRDKIELVYSGVEIPDLGQASAGRPVLRQALGLRDTKVLMTMGRLVAWKRIDVAIRALSHLVQARGDVRLVVMGDGPDRAELEALARSSGVAEAVQFLGARTDVLGCLAAADVFVMPSTAEGLGLALLEAMATGLPVVVTRSSPFDEVVTDGEDGLMAEPGDPADFAAKIARIFASNDLARRMGSRARQTVTERFSAKQSVRKLEKVYTRVASCRSPGLIDDDFAN